MNQLIEITAGRPSGRTRTLTAASLAGLLGLAGCGPASETVTVSGATTWMPAMALAAERYEATHPGVRIDVQGGGTTKGILDTASGLSDIALIAREPTDSERLLVEPLGLAKDGLAVIVHRDLPLEATTLGQLKTLYAAKDPGTLAGRRVTRIAKATVHGTAEAFALGIGLPLEAVLSEVVAGSNGEVIAVASSTRDAIGYVSHADALAAVAEGAPLRVIPVEGVMASAESVGDGRYPLARVLHLAVRRPSVKAPMAGGPTKTVRDFLDWMRGPEGARVIRDSGFVPVEG